MSQDRIMAAQHHEFDNEKLMDALESRQEKKMNLEVNMSETQMVEDGTTIVCNSLSHGPKSFRMNKTATEQTLELFEAKTGKELPVETFLNVLSPAERQSVWNREITAINAKRMIRVHAPVNENTREINFNGICAAYANVSTKYKPLDNVVVASIMRQSEIPIVAVQGSVLDTDHSKFRFIPKGSKDVAVGEFTPGFEVTNSESGNGALEFYAFVYRKICSNGMMVKVDGLGASYRQIHIGNGAFIDIPDMGKLWEVASRAAQIHNDARFVRCAADYKIHIVNMAKDSGMLNGQIESFIDTANQFYHGGNTVANVVGSITHAAQKYRKDETKKRTEMELFANRTLEYLMGKAA